MVGAGDEPGAGLDRRTIVEQVKQEGAAAKTAEGKAEDEGHSEPVIKEWIGLLVRAGLWALVIYLFIFQVSVVKGDSMQPNFQSGDRLLIDKIVYRFRDPQPGDVVVFEAMVDENGKHTFRDYVKRIIAGPNSEVAIHDNAVFVNGEKLKETWTHEDFRETFETGPEATMRRTYKVPPGRYFVLGDQRWNSQDSRESSIRPGTGKIGFVPEGQIKGKVRWRFWPPERWTWY